MAQTMIRTATAAAAAAATTATFRSGRRRARSHVASSASMRFGVGVGVGGAANPMRSSSELWYVSYHPSRTRTAEIRSKPTKIVKLAAPPGDAVFGPASLPVSSASRRRRHCVSDSHLNGLPLSPRLSLSETSRFSSLATADAGAANDDERSRASRSPRLRPVSILDDMDLLDRIPLEDVRNFCFIAHVDHGKSSLASRVLELAGNLGGEAQATSLEAAGLGAIGEIAGKDTPVEEAASKSIGEGDGPALLRRRDDRFVDPVQQAGGKEGANANNGGGGRNNTLSQSKEKIDLLDTLSVEKERGITVKASAASMLYRHPSAVGPAETLLINMVDTPGHADFGTEVTRGLLSVSGAVLLFDAAQGVQAQTLSVYEKARSMGISVLPALTKVDLPTARPLDVALAVSDLFGFDPDDILLTSARTRRGVAEVLDAVCRKIQPPEPLPDDNDDGIGGGNGNGGGSSTLRAKVVDSWYEPTRGVICLVQILSGSLKEGDRVSVVEPPTPAAATAATKASFASDDDDNDDDNHVSKMRTGTGTGTGTGEEKQSRAVHRKEQFSVQDVGLVLPRRLRTGKLGRGQMGYVVAGMRDPRQAKPGTVLILHKDLARIADIIIPERNSGVPAERSVLFASVHPTDGDGFDDLCSAVDRLALNDTGLEVHRTSSGSSNASSSSERGGPFLGPGLRVGFQGLLHVEVFRQRLLDEFGMEAIVTPPKVPYTIRYLSNPKHPRPAGAPAEEVIEDLSKWPPHGVRFKVLEPVVDVRIMAPLDRAGDVMDLVKRKRGSGMDTRPVDESTWLFSARMPWAEVVTDFHDELKNVTAGYASFDTSEADPPLQESDLTKVDIVLNGDVVGPLAFVCHRDAAQAQARIVCRKLKEVLPRHQFVVVVQAMAEGRIVASERVKAYRKDVLAIGGGKTVGGGDITRKKKLLAKQKEGKKRQQTTGKVTLSQAAFNSVVSRT